MNTHTISDNAIIGGDFRGFSFPEGLPGTEFWGVDFQHADLSGVDVSGMVFGNCRFDGAILNSSFARADLRGSWVDVAATDAFSIDRAQLARSSARDLLDMGRNWRMAQSA